VTGSEEAAWRTVSFICSSGKILLQKYEELLKQAEVFSDNLYSQMEFAWIL